MSRKPTNKAKQSPKAARQLHLSLVGLGFVLYVLAWFSPVVRTAQDLGPIISADRLLAAGHGGPEWLPGWAANLTAWNMLVQEAPHDAALMPSGLALDETKRRVLGATCLTNLMMVLAFVLTLRGLAPIGARCTGAVLLGCAVLDSTWVWLSGVDSPFGAWHVGYYLWAGSFALVGAGLLGARDH